MKGLFLWRVGGGVIFCTKMEIGLVPHFRYFKHKSIRVPIYSKISLTFLKLINHKLPVNMLLSPQRNSLCFTCSVNHRV